MPNAIELTLAIDAPRARVWSVFADPRLSREMGGEYVTEWVVGSSFRWRGANGELYTDGTIVEIEPGERLKHTVRSSIGDTASVITYDFREEDGGTLLLAKEEFESEITDEQREDALAGWRDALDAVKKIAEGTSA